MHKNGSMVALLVSCALWGNVAQAQPRPERCAELKAEAEKYEAEKKYSLLNETLRLRASECPTAVAFFEAGVALIRVDASVDAGDPEEGKAGQRLLLAMNYLEEALRRKDPPLSAVNAAAATFHMGELQKKLVLIRLVPADVRERFAIELDGQEVKLSADRFWATPGAHALVLTPKAVGYEIFVPALPALVAGKTQIVQVPEPAAKPERTAAPIVGESRALPSGASRTVKKRAVGAVILGSTGAALLVAGAVTGGVAMAKASDLESSCPNKTCPPDMRDTKHQTKLLANTTDVLLATGGVALAAGIVWYVFFPSKEREPIGKQARIQPAIARSHVGVAVRGAF